MIAEINSKLDFGKKHTSLSIPNNYSLSGNYDYLIETTKQNI